MHIHVFNLIIDLIPKILICVVIYLYYIKKKDHKLPLALLLISIGLLMLDFAYQAWRSSWIG